MKTLNGLIIVAVASLGLASVPVMAAEATIERCDAISEDLKNQVSEKLTGDSLKTAEAFLTKMDKACENKLFSEAGAAALDVLIEIKANEG